MCVAPSTTYALLGDRIFELAEVVVETEVNRGVFPLMRVRTKAVVQVRVGRQYVFLVEVLGISLMSTPTTSWMRMVRRVTSNAPRVCAQWVRSFRGCVFRIITLENPFGKYSLVRDKHGETVGAFVRKGSVGRDKVPRLTSSHQRWKFYIYINACSL